MGSAREALSAMAAGSAFEALECRSPATMSLPIPPWLIVDGATRAVVIASRGS
jgi:hypothetical protein